VRVALLVRVEPVVAPLGGWLAAHSAWFDEGAPARGAVDLVPPLPNHDHDDECGDMNQGDENDQGGQAAAAHFYTPSYLVQAAPATISSSFMARSTSQARSPSARCNPRRVTTYLLARARSPSSML
jgi:hypothetical protein